MSPLQHAVAAISFGEQNANEGDEGLAQVPPAPVPQITAQSCGMRQLGTCSMIRSQRKAHLRVWTVPAVFLPLGLALILSLAASQVIERAPQRLEQPGAAQGAGG